MIQFILKLYVTDDNMDELKENVRNLCQVWMTPAARTQELGRWTLCCASGLDEKLVKAVFLECVTNTIGKTRPLFWKENQQAFLKDLARIEEFRLDKQCKRLQTVAIDKISD